MKAKIKSVTGTEAQVIAAVDILDDAGNIVLSRNVPIISTESDTTKAQAYITQTLQAIANQYNQEKASSLKSEIEKLVGSEIAL